MKNGTYIAMLDLRDEYEIAELHNGKWHTFRSLQQKFSEKDVIKAEIIFDNPVANANLTVIFPDPDKAKEHGVIFAKKVMKINDTVELDAGQQRMTDAANALISDTEWIDNGVKKAWEDAVTITTTKP